MDESWVDEDKQHFRRITDPSGRDWLVRERVMSYDRRSACVLLFENPYVVRVVRTFPADWHGLGLAELVELSEHV